MYEILKIKQSQGQVNKSWEQNYFNVKVENNLKSHEGNPTCQKLQESRQMDQEWFYAKVRGKKEC